MSKIEHTPLTEHHVVVQLLGQPLPQLQRVLIEFGIAIKLIVGTHDGSIATGVATAQPTFFEYRNILYAVQLCQIVGSRQSMPPGAHDNDIV